MALLDWLIDTGCDHKWETVSEHVQKSPLQLMIDAPGKYDVDGLGDITHGTHVFIQNCTKCGKVYKSVTKV